MFASVRAFFSLRSDDVDAAAAAAVGTTLNHKQVLVIQNAH